MNHRPSSLSVPLSHLLFIGAIALLGGCDDGGSAPTEPLATGGTSNTSPAVGQGGTAQTTQSSLPTTCTVDGTCANPNSQGNCAAAEEFFCVASCSVAVPAATSAVCEQGRWSCPTGYTSIDACPKRSCATSYQQCCNSETGEVALAACGADGLQSDCSAGTTTESSHCMPRGVSVTDCYTLDQKSCGATSQHCITGDSFCNCQSDEAGALTWRCAVRLGY